MWVRNNRKAFEFLVDLKMTQQAIKLMAVIINSAHFDIMSMCSHFLILDKVPNKNGDRKDATTSSFVTHLCIRTHLGKLR